MSDTSYETAPVGSYILNSSHALWRKNEADNNLWEHIYSPHVGVRSLGTRPRVALAKCEWHRTMRLVPQQHEAALDMLTAHPVPDDKIRQHLQRIWQSFQGT